MMEGLMNKTDQERLKELIYNLEEIMENNRNFEYVNSLNKV